MATDTIETTTAESAITPAFTALLLAVDNVVKHYRDDLLKHDRRFCADNPDCQFLHFAGDCGTHVVELWPVEKFPAKGATIPYLFGVADRWHLLNEGLSAVVNMPKYNRPVGHYWNGKSLIPIDFKRAETIYRDYMKRIAYQFD